MASLMYLAVPRPPLIAAARCLADATRELEAADRRVTPAWLQRRRPTGASPLRGFNAYKLPENFLIWTQDRDGT